MNVEVSPEPGQAKVYYDSENIDIRDLKGGHSKERIQSIIFIQSLGGF